MARKEIPIHGRLTALACALLLAACDPAPTGPEPSEPATPPPASEPAPSPAPESPPPTEPTPAPTPTSAESLDVRSMQAAIPSRKISVPVELRYHFDAAPAPGKPVTLHLAALPRAAGTRLAVNITKAEGLEVDAAPLTVAKVAAGGVYRQQLKVTRRDATAARIRVVVTMDQAQGSGFGFFTIPLDGGDTAQKQAPTVKQR